MKKFLRVFGRSFSFLIFFGAFLFFGTSSVYSNTYTYGSARSIFGIKTSLAESCSMSYVTTGPEAQVKTGVLGILGLFKAYSGINLDMNRVVNVGAPVVGTDVATRAYVDQAIANAKGCSCP